MVSALHHRHPKGKCVISGHVFPKGHIFQWNTRATQPDPRDEVIKGLMEALDTIASDRCCEAEPWYIAYQAWHTAYAALAAAKTLTKENQNDYR